MGPLVSEKQALAVAGFVDRACQSGASILTGGERVGEIGSFYAPSVVTDVKPDMEIVREEVFGPVIVCTPFDDIEEVTELANDTDYGLAAGVWTENLSHAHRIAASVRAGTVWINCH